MMHGRRSVLIVIGFFVCLMACSSNAKALEELWHFDVFSPARSLPVAVDYDGDGKREVVFSTQHDGSVWSMAADGSVAGRYRRPQWIAGGIAAAEARGAHSYLFAFEESTGKLSLADFATGLNLWLDVPGDPHEGTPPAFADLNGDGTQEIICVRKNGTITAMDRALTVLWQFGADGAFDSAPATAPVFERGSAVYALTTSGILFCVDGQGIPQWQFAMRRPTPQAPSFSDPIVAELLSGSPVVLVGDAAGTLYALDAATGKEYWRRPVATCAIGNPALLDVRPPEGIDIVTVSEKGEIAVLNGSGVVMTRASLPKGDYVPRPLVADVDGDAEPDVLVPTKDWRLLVASLDGQVKDEVSLLGNVRDGAVLADLDDDGLLELLAATDCARIACFRTRARSGWTHPRGGPACSGFIPPITRAVLPESKPRTHSAPERISVSLSDYIEDVPFSTAVVDMGKAQKKLARAVLSDSERVLGAAVRSIETGAFSVPFARYAAGPFSLDLSIVDDHGKVELEYKPIEVTPNAITPVLLPSRDAFVAALNERGSAYALPEQWTPAPYRERNTWSVVHFRADSWMHFGLAAEPFIRDAMPIVGPADSDVRFGPEHPAWNAMQTSTLPFLVSADFPQLRAPYPAPALRAIMSMAGDRFAGFAVNGWPARTWESLENDHKTPKTRTLAQELFRKDFQQLLNQTQGHLYPGSGPWLFAHQAYAWGAPMAYAEIGKDIPCAPLQFAFMRGASRQFGGKPWGVSIGNEFAGATLDTLGPAEAPRIRWTGQGQASGPDCGHSASLEFRLAMAASLAGATFVRNEADAQNDSGFVQKTSDNAYSLSEHGQAFKTWYDFTQTFPERGYPVTPIAFMVDRNHGWRPGQPAFGVWPQGRAEQSLEAVFGHVFPCGDGLDFEQGQLANGPYGDIFDVITDDAPLSVLQTYAVIWPVGDIEVTRALRDSLDDYVAKGGILVIDGGLARWFPESFTGVRVDEDTAFACGIQTALQSITPIAASFRYYRLDALTGTQPIAWTDKGQTLACWHNYKSGLVLVAGTRHWIDISSGLVPIAPVLMRLVADAVSPVSVLGDVEWFVSRTSTGYVVGLINNSGISKSPTVPALVDPTQSRDCVVAVRGEAPTRFVSRMGEFNWNTAANALEVRLAPGGVGVVELVLGGA
ncbi:MAG: PQQ-binding-like beta-propeller repeat protein [Candidatus Hydrogenedentes bacterium]|nr:PQQ-binding-like beta-propeller repeat protein [Candidatus Hydrogenedentota bacterium]